MEGRGAYLALFALLLISTGCNGLFGFDEELVTERPWCDYMNQVHAMGMVFFDFTNCLGGIRAVPPPGMRQPPPPPRPLPPHITQQIFYIPRPAPPQVIVMPPAAPQVIYVTNPPTTTTTPRLEFVQPSYMGGKK